ACRHGDHQPRDHDPPLWTQYDGFCLMALPIPRCAAIYGTPFRPPAEAVKASPGASGSTAGAASQQCAARRLAEPAARWCAAPTATAPCGSPMVVFGISSGYFPAMSAAAVHDLRQALERRFPDALPLGHGTATAVGTGV